MTTRRFALALLSLLLAACATRARKSGPAEWLSRVQRPPLDVTEIEATASNNVHAIFLRLSRFPDRIEHEAKGDPPRIELRLVGPASDGDAPEKTLVPSSAVVRSVRVSRKDGILRVLLELGGNELPEYTIHEMADWLMVRMVPKR